MGKQVITVELNDNKVVYYNGDTISGNLVYDSDEAFEIKCECMLDINNIIYSYWLSDLKYKSHLQISSLQSLAVFSKSDVHSERKCMSKHGYTYYFE